MKVFANDTGETRLIGRCDVPDDAIDVLEVPLFGRASIIMERFAIGNAHFFRGDGTWSLEQGVLLIPGQDPSLLPGWQPLAS